MQNLTLSVDGMTCSHCESRVKKAVSSLNGVSSVNVDLSGNTVSIELDPSAVTEKQVKDAIEDQGYQVV